jgi:hypothetical protein
MRAAQKADVILLGAATSRARADMVELEEGSSSAPMPVFVDIRATKLVSGRDRAPNRRGHAACLRCFPRTGALGEAKALAEQFLEQEVNCFLD